MKKVLLALALCMIGGGALFTLSGCAESAYDIAVRNGFKGTESQWLESLKGSNGQNGENGVDYEDIRNLYDDIISKGEYSGTFLQFVRDYINVYDIGYEVVANQCVLSSVSVWSYYMINSTEYLSAGSGIIYQMDETNNEVYIVTNYHVVYVYENEEIADEITINLYGAESDSAEITCSFIGGSEAYDIAVLKAEGAEAKKIIDSDAEAVELGEFNDYSLGETLIAIGNPQAEGLTVVTGVLSADSKTVAYSISNKTYNHRVIQLDAPINTGNSGGGIFNSDGFLVGLVSSKHMSSYTSSGLDVVEGMSYGIPLTHIVSIADYCIKNCDGVSNTVAKMYMLGIQYTSANSKARYDTSLHKTVITEDVAVYAINAGSLAEEIGLESDDLIKSIKITKGANGTIEFDITRGFMLRDVLMFLEEGDKIEITIVRNKTEQTLNEYQISSADNKFIKTYEEIA